MKERQMNHWRRSVSIGLLSLLAGCRDHGKDGGSALDSFRTYVAKSYGEKFKDSECDLRTDVRATQGVAEPWEGVLHADIFILEKDGRRNPFGWSVDAVFDRAASDWTCSQTKSKASDPTMRACETLTRFCTESAPAKHARPATVTTLYPDGWKDLPRFGDLVEIASKSWRCTDEKSGSNATIRSCTLCKPSARFKCATLSFDLADKNDKVPRHKSMMLTFEPTDDTSYDVALASLQANRKPDDIRRSHEEFGDHQTACWRNSESVTAIENGFPIARGSIVVVTTADNDLCRR
ncbi:MAG: hypothetical protein KF773_38290 [Deltaproteobacteria bacterium]|nr:hypothetical protein [Deltaproteobacteria bacterium]